MRTRGLAGSSGGDGDDRLVGGVGDDTLVGGTGVDTLVFDRDSGRDVIRDFSDEDILLVCRPGGSGYMTDEELAHSVRTEIYGDSFEYSVEIFLAHEGGRILFENMMADEVIGQILA